MSKKLTQEEFINRAKSIHGDKYDYSLVQYKNIDTKVTIICPQHGKFDQIPYHHTKGCGCKDCSGITTVTTDSFIIKSKKIHNNKYDYSLVKYKNFTTKLIIICPRHGEFMQNAADHLSGRGCMSCCLDGRSLSQEEFITKANKLHNRKYDYSKVQYEHNKTPVTIICPKHGEFNQTPNIHIYAQSGCPLCRSSRGEKKIYNWLIKFNFDFIYQIKFEDCKFKRCLPFDFGVYFKDKLFLIEYQGQHHYEPVNFGGSSQSFEIFERTKQNDEIKRNFCKTNNYELLEVRYDCDNIFEFLADKLS